MKDEATKPLHSRAVKPGQTQSIRIKANQTKSNQIKPAARLACPEIGQFDAERGRRKAAYSKLAKPNQTGSNRVKPRFVPRNRVTSRRSLAVPSQVKPSQTQFKVNQTKSNQIKPARGKYLWHMDLHRIGMEFGWVLGLPRMDANRRQSIQATTRSNPVKPNQGESNQIKPNQTCEVEAPMPQGVAQKRNGVRRDF
jgi:hypothetical protein